MRLLSSLEIDAAVVDTLGMDTHTQRLPTRVLQSPRRLRPRFADWSGEFGGFGGFGSLNEDWR